MRFIGLLAAATCAMALAQSPGQYATLNGVLWQQTSEEYQALGLQAFSTARIMLDRALKDKKWTAAAEQTGNFKKLPPAVIFDADDTLVDSSGGQARFILDGNGRYDPRIWREWIDLPGGRPTPGALDFVQYARGRGVAIFYVTNRDASEEAETRKQLAALGFPVVEVKTGEIGDTLLTVNEKPGWTTDKSVRRKLLAQHYRILLLGGDDLNDFMPGARSSVEERRKLAAQYQGWWGRKWIVLPNPNYGSWENSLWNFKSGLSGQEVLDIKVRALRRE
ncbi:MAG: hypothetical protein IT161_22605 [Bryobacterales bacterium]|nr:hypothetical protein [Bryobacterales bacterium]